VFLLGLTLPMSQFLFGIPREYAFLISTTRGPLPMR
jgi:hypothetical protein